MTKVRFTFVDIQGNPLPLMEFKLIVRRASFNIEDVGVTLPEEITVTTDVTGQVIVDLWPLKTAYRIQVAEEYEELCGKLNWSFYVPHTNEIVEAQTLFLVPPPNSLPWDEEAMGKITQAVIDSKDSAEASEASAVRAENAAQSIEGDADRAEAARDAAIAAENSAVDSANTATSAANAAVGSANAASSSASQASTSATSAGQSAASAQQSKEAAAGSATSASASKDAAANSATAASGSATTATNAANSATASQDAAAGSANTASTKASEASTSAGNALTQANRAKTEADRAVAATDNKQDKSARLTAISGLSGTANRYSVPAIFANTDAVVPVLVAQDPRDTTVGAMLQVGHGGWGGASPIYLAANENLNTLPQTGLFIASSTNTNIPGGGLTDFFIENMDNGNGWRRQRAIALTGEKTYTRFRHGGNGNWSRWDEVLSTFPAIEAYSADKLRMRDNLGICTPHTYCTNIDALTPAQGLVLGHSYVNGTTIGTKPGGYGFGIVNTVVNNADHCQQDFVGLNGVAGVTQRAYRRSGYGTQWGSWHMIIDSVSAGYDVESAGGVVSRTIISGCVVNKFTSGLIVINGSFGTTSTIAANESQAVNVTIPANTGADTSYATAVCTASAYITNDWYGIINAAVTTPTNIQLVIRNGATPQQFAVRGIVIGHWK